VLCRNGADVAQLQTCYQSISSILSWDMMNLVLRVWLQMSDTGGRQKQDSEWDLQEASIKVIKCVPFSPMHARRAANAA
jgi:hypothetical protein